VQGGLSACPNKLFAELGSCKDPLHNLTGAAGTSDDGQSIPAATLAHPKLCRSIIIDPLSQPVLQIIEHDYTFTRVPYLHHRKASVFPGIMHQ
jgi:hypothetical protein